jgi:hypothetical protein
MNQSCLCAGRRSNNLTRDSTRALSLLLRNGRATDIFVGPIHLHQQFNRESAASGQCLRLAQAAKS